jgi:hypothetical protein
MLNKGLSGKYTSNLQSDKGTPSIDSDDCKADERQDERGVGGGE